jgi:hypothetical protein
MSTLSGWIQGSCKQQASSKDTAMTHAICSKHTAKTYGEQEVAARADSKVPARTANLDSTSKQPQASSKYAASKQQEASKHTARTQASKQQQEQTTNRQ